MLIDIQPLETKIINNTKFSPPKIQLLKWVGSKLKFAPEMSNYFPENFNNYHEPFLGSGSILATIAPKNGYASDTFSPLIEIWQTLKTNPELLISWYKERRDRIETEDKNIVYEDIKRSFNTNPNGPDFLYLTRACWGGIIRFRKLDGYMSTPCGSHGPISVDHFRLRVIEWHHRIKNTTFECADYKDAFKKAKKGDFVYCDPPYVYSQTILYGSQNFNLNDLFECIIKAKAKGVYVAMSIDGSSKSGITQKELAMPNGLFERSIEINNRISMLLRFKKIGKTLTTERDSEKLYLTYL